MKQLVFLFLIFITLLIFTVFYVGYNQGFMDGKIQEEIQCAQSIHGAVSK
jgi:hypothetical protein